MTKPYPNPLTLEGAEIPLMERLGVRFLRHYRHKAEVGGGDDAIHILNAEEQRALKQVERRASYKAFAAGAVAGFITGGTEVLTMPESGLIEESWLRWTIVGVVVSSTAILEVGYLYIMCLDAVNDLAHTAGFDLREEEESAEVTYTIHALARAALEVPNPRGEVFGVDPHSEASKFWLIFAGLVYKGKVGLTNFILKAVLRRLLARVGARWAASYIAIPVVAVWNLVVVRKVLREARIRVIGPSAVRVLTGLLLDEVGVPESEDGQHALSFAVGCCIVRSLDMHPNLRILLSIIVERAGVPDAERMGDIPYFIALLPKLTPMERGLALRTAVIAAILDGRMSRRERKLLHEAFAASNQTYPGDAIDTLIDRFRNGELIEMSHLEAIAPLS